MAANPSSGLDPAETKEVERIATEYFQQTTDSPEEAQEMLQKLAGAVQEDGAKLVHLGNVLFLIMVRGKGTVEVHIIGEEQNPQMMVSNIKQLVAYLKSIEVKTAYAYTDDPRFERLAQMTQLPYKTFKADVEGREMTVFVLEI